MMAFRRGIAPVAAVSASSLPVLFLAPERMAGRARWSGCMRCCSVDAVVGRGLGRPLAARPAALGGLRWLGTEGRRGGEGDGKRQKPPTQPAGSKPPLRDKLKQNLAKISNFTPRENIYNLPNILTFSRLVAAPVVGYLILHDQHLWAVGLFAYAGITDMVDGWMARKWKLQTVVGSVVDPMADKTLMTITVVCLAVKGTLPLPLATLILGRDISLAIAAIYYRWASLPAPKTLARYWDFSLPSAEVHPTAVSKFNTFLQLILIGGTLALPLLISVPGVDQAAVAAQAETVGGVRDAVVGAFGGEESIATGMRALQTIVAGTTAWSGMSYAFNRKAVRILGENEALKRKQGFRGRAIIGVCMAGVVGLSGLLWMRGEESDEEKER